MYATAGKDRTGIGVAQVMAQRAVKANGGWISAQDRLEGGLCIEMALPVE